MRMRNSILLRRATRTTRAMENDVELAFGQDQQGAIFLGSPAHFRDGADFMPDEFATQAGRNALIKQNSHAPAPNPWPVPGPPQRARDSRSGSPSGSYRACRLPRE